MRCPRATHSCCFGSLLGMVHSFTQLGTWANQTEQCKEIAKAHLAIAPKSPELVGDISQTQLNQLEGEPFPSLRKRTIAPHRLRAILRRDKQAIAASKRKGPVPKIEPFEPFEVANGFTVACHRALAVL